MCVYSLHTTSACACTSICCASALGGRRARGTSSLAMQQLLPGRRSRGGRRRFAGSGCWCRRCRCSGVLAIALASAGYARVGIAPLCRSSDCSLRARSIIQVPMHWPTPPTTHQSTHQPTLNPHNQPTHQPTHQPTLNPHRHPHSHSPGCPSWFLLIALANVIWTHCRQLDEADVPTSTPQHAYAFLSNLMVILALVAAPQLVVASVSYFTVR